MCSVRCHLSASSHFFLILLVECLLCFSDIHFNLCRAQFRFPSGALHDVVFGLVAPAPGFGDFAQDTFVAMRSERQLMNFATRRSPARSRASPSRSSCRMPLYRRHRGGIIRLDVHVAVCPPPCHRGLFLEKPGDIAEGCVNNQVGLDLPGEHPVPNVEATD